jgi:hypothetical protein
VRTVLESCSILAPEQAAIADMSALSGPGEYSEDGSMYIQLSHL